MKRLYPLLVSGLLMASCHNNNIVFDQTTEFPSDRWNHFKPEKYDINIRNEEDYYNINFTVSVDTALYRYDEFPAMIEMTSPAGEQRQFYHTTMLKENGRWRGEQQGKYRIVEGRVRSYFTFNRKGTHEMDISQITGQYDLEGIHSLQVQVERTELEYNL